MEKCCDDEVVAYQGQGFDHQNLTINTVAPAFVMIAPPVVLLSEVIPSVANIPQTDTYYDPPLPAIDRVVSLQTFLI